MFSKKKIMIWLIIGLLVLFVVRFPKPNEISTPDYEVSSLKFPPDFIWGAATAAHQVEGNQDNNLTEWERLNANRIASEAEARFSKIVPDWEAIKAEATNPNNYISGPSTDHYNRYEEDLDLARQIGLNAYRFSIEWSRIEPKAGEFNVEALDHYREVIAAVRERSMTPFVTLWHRSQPKWLVGDWENTQTIERYVKFVSYVVEGLKNEVDYWLPFNEPVLHVAAGYVDGTLPPQVKSLKRANDVFKNMIEAHRQVYRLIHEKDTSALVGSTHAIQYATADPNTIVNKTITSILNYNANERFMANSKDEFDFIAIQYYGPVTYRLTTNGVKTFRSHDQTRTDFGWDIYPAGIYIMIKDLYSRFQKPVFITENGIADRSDKLRAKYISDHLYWIKKAMDEGIPIKGYFYWSLLDNSEWDSGFWPRFGLIEVDYNNNLKRTLRPSALEFKKIIENSK